MEKYDPRKDLGACDIVARAIDNEMKKAVPSTYTSIAATWTKKNSLSTSLIFMKNANQLVLMSQNI